MFSVPSFLSFPWSFQLPSLPSISLPANIQRRFLSFVLKRFLGRFIKGRGLDVERIQAQIGEGRVDIEGLELDTEEVNALIPPSLPFTVTSGSLSKVSARLPFPNLWSAPLSISLDELSLDLLLVSTPSKPAESEKGKQPRPGLGARALSVPLDLASSVTTAADEFLHEELDAYEEAELDRSIRQSLILSQTDPFATANDDLPGAFPGTSRGSMPTSPGSPLAANVESTTVLAGLVERILARLEFKVSNIKIRITHHDPKYGGIFELRVGEIKYADESAQAPIENSTSTIRTVRVSQINLYLLPPTIPKPAPPAPPTFFSTTTRSSSHSSSSSAGYSDGTSSGDEGNDDMMMSMAVADLRHSVAMTAASGASVYQSALTERPIEEEDTTMDSEDSARVATPTLLTAPKEADKRESQDNHLILSFGSDDIILKMTTSVPTPAFPTALSSSPTGNVRGASIAMPGQPVVSFDLSMGTVTSVILPSHAAIILSAMQIAIRPSTSTNTSASIEQSRSNQTRLEASVRLKALYASIVYDLSANKQPLFREKLTQYWTKPYMTDLPAGHLKARLDTLSATYSSHAAAQETPSASQDRHRTPKRTPSAKTRTSPSFKASLQDASIFEYLASAAAEDDGSPPGGTFPVLIFDSNLLKQYEHVSTASLGSKSAATAPATFPTFDGIDWRNANLQRRGPAGEKVWKVRPKGRGVLKGGHNAPIESLDPVIAVRKSLTPGTPAKIETLPVHIFLDLSLLERLLPMLRHISPVVKHTEASETPQAFGRPVMPPRKSVSSVLDDLDAQASSLLPQPGAAVASIKCPMIRFDIRCPAPPNRRGSWGDGAHLRSGIVTLDIHGIDARIVGSAETLRATHSMGKQQSGTSVQCQKMIMFFSRVPSNKSLAFLIVGPLASGIDDLDSTVLLPRVSISSSVNASTDLKTSSVVCQIPSVQADIHQSTIEGLQFFADDITHWLDGAFGDGSRPKPRDELKMIGSRFFGSKASSSTSSSAIEDEEDEPTSATVISLAITEVDATLHVPRSASGAEELSQRILSLKASDLNTELQSNTAGRKESVVVLTVMDIQFSDNSGISPRLILDRTTAASLAGPVNPLIWLQLSSLADPVTDTKETTIKTSLTAFTFHVSEDLSWMEDLKTFAKTPEGVFEDVVPSEITRISVIIHSGSLHLSPPNNPGALVLFLGHLDFSTDLVSGADEALIELSLTNSSVFMVDNLDCVQPLRPDPRVSDIWLHAGYAQLLLVEELLVEVWRDLTGSHEIRVDVSSCLVKAFACADSLASVGPLVSELTKLIPSKEESKVPARSQMALEQSIDVFASIDEDAFNRIPDMISGADLIEDDLPTNLDYLDQTTRRTEVSTDKTTGETLRSWQTTEDGDLDARLHSEVNGETIKVLYAEPFDMQEDYWDSLTPLTPAERDDEKSSKIKLRVDNCAISVFLHDGYDWQRTRKAIEDEMKIVRKRLERIRQLLASGQQADESIDHTRSVLFNSVYIGVGQERDMDSAALLAAIDEELGDLGNDTSSISSWQTDFPAGHPNHRPPTTTKTTRLRGKRLGRSKKPQIEFSLKGIKLDVDSYDIDNPTSSRIHATVGSMEILDHIKTSTWKKFLTEMKSDSRGNVRETDADMFRVELTGSRPSLPSLEEEYRLKAKILPLRLHVDQDALDFLKRFFAFSAPSSVTSVPVVSKNASAEAFFQHVEIFPIELKLDYKPKRVDFAALREGITMELMNFFHFDGAEMTLRHITLSGISGVTKLSTTLQDIWTPDVKANQLADVISGVSPIRSIVNVGSGVADLILLPIEQYRKDGRVARGVQRGTNSFVKSTALEMMKLGAKLATGTQVILEKAEGVLGGKLGDKEVVGEVSWQMPSNDHGDGGDGSSEDETTEMISRYANQPTTAKEGVQAAYKSLSKNVNAAAQTILAVPMEVYERSGDDGPLKAVVRAVPIAVLKPMIGASEAVSKTLLGVRNSLDPQGREELGDKYK